MKTCFQSQGQSILEHGHSVHNYFLDLYNHLYNGEALNYEWRLPEWVINNKDFIKSKLYSLDILRDYMVYHDCAKPLCVTIDENQKQHFPNHSYHSKQRWLECSTDTPRNAQVGELIGMDMDIHLLKSDGLEVFCGGPEAISLLIAGLCEVHSNAAMFGGIESTSFKIKWKHINKMGNRITNLIKEHDERC